MDKLRQTVRFMRQNGLLKLKTGEFDIELHPAAIALPAKRTKKDEGGPEIPPVTYSEMDVLMWSSPGFQSEVEGEEIG